MAHVLERRRHTLREIISPAGFENFFRELAEVYAAGESDPVRFADLCARYALEMDPESVPGLCERFNLTHPMLA